MLLSIEETGLLLLGVITLIQIYYYVVIFLTNFISQNDKILNENELPPVSVIVYLGYNVEFNQDQFRMFFNQKYSKYQIILLNDSGKILETSIFPSDENIFKLVDVSYTENFWMDKKYAYTLGIKSAKYKYILMTDFNCSSISPNWIKGMASYLTKKVDMVLGAIVYTKVYTFTDSLVKYYKMLDTIKYISAAKANKAYMGDGANILFNKDIFFKIGGYKSQLNFSYAGEDKLFVNEVAKFPEVNIAVCKDPDTILFKEKDELFRKFFTHIGRDKKIRKRYSFSQRFRLSLFNVSQFLFWAVLVTMIVLCKDQKDYLYLTLEILLVRILFVQISLYRMAKELNQGFLGGIYSLFIEPIAQIYYFFIFLFSIFIKTKKR